MDKFYAGIGSRKTPSEVQFHIGSLAIDLAKLGYILRSGGAKGADWAFEAGVNVSGFPKSKEIYRPEDVTPEAISLAKKFHPNWNALTYQGQQLIARNGFQILGKNLDKPVDFVICWTGNGSDSGGTGQAIRIAWSLNIPVYNLQKKLYTVKDIFNDMENKL